eukprot:gene7182-7753_t
MILNGIVSFHLRFLLWIFVFSFYQEGLADRHQSRYHHYNQNPSHNKLDAPILRYLKQHFSEQYYEQCSIHSKYHWIEKYVNNFHNYKKYTIFIWEDRYPRPKKGGFGDRLAGLLSAFLWSVRSNRTFLIESTHQKEIFNYFQPFPYHSFHSKYNLENFSLSLNTDTLRDREDEDEDRKHLKWSDWGKYFHFSESEYSSSDKSYLWCINPKQRQLECGLDDANALSKYSVVRIRLNRCYFCRWMTDPSLPAYHELRQSFNLTSDDNLFQLAGCILRNILWPTNTLWNEIYKNIINYQKNQLKSIKFSSPSSVLQRPNSLIGIHFRCGDHNYYESQKVVLHFDLVHHTSCTVKANEKWNGTKAVYEFSSASPIDMANCAQTHYQQLLTQDDSKQQSTQSNKPWFFITSDSMESSYQIHETLNHSINQTIIASNGCHFDYNPSSDCIVQTIVSWFLLSMNNRTIVQSYYSEENKVYLPSSSFARYAMIYSLQPNSFDVGDSCYNSRRSSDRKEKFESISPYSYANTSLLPQGNWVCMGGKTIY